MNVIKRNCKRCSNDDLLFNARGKICFKCHVHNFTTDSVTICFLYRYAKHATPLQSRIKIQLQMSPAFKPDETALIRPLKLPNSAKADPQPQPQPAVVESASVKSDDDEVSVPDRIDTALSKSALASSPSTTGSQNASAKSFDISSVEVSPDGKVRFLYCLIVFREIFDWFAARMWCKVDVAVVHELWDCLQQQRESSEKTVSLLVTYLAQARLELEELQEKCQRLEQATNTTWG